MEFKAGFNRQVLNPTEPVPLAGYVNDGSRYHETIRHDICATCVALSDGEDTVLLIGFDVTVAGTEFSQLLRERLEKETGIPQDKMYLAGTHTHAGPGLGEQAIQRQFAAIERYWVQFADGVSEAARLAIADMKPASICVGSIETNNLTFVKHYKMCDKASGEVSYIGDVFGTQQGKSFLGHATEVDRSLHLVKFAREAGKDIVLSNFRGHPHFDGGGQNHVLSSDFIGAYRKALESMVDCDVLYLQGASGNVNTSTRLEDERRYTCSTSHGMALAAYAIECLSRYMIPLEAGKLRTKQVEIYGDKAEVDPEILQGAREVTKMWVETHNLELCKAAAEERGMRSSYQALAIVGRAEREQKDLKMVLNALAIGDKLAIVTFPGELFENLAARVEDQSPFDHTLVMGYAHHQVGYLPAMSAFKYTSYETDITRFTPGTGEIVADKYIEMLKELK